MKTSKKLIGLFILALFFAFSATKAMAKSDAPNEKMGVKIHLTEKSQKVEVRLRNLLGYPTKIRVRTNTGQVIYRENIKETPGYAKILDLSRLTEGNYTISVVQEGKSITQHLNIGEFDIVLGNVETLTITAPIDHSLASSKY